MRFEQLQSFRPPQNLKSIHDVKLIDSETRHILVVENILAKLPPPILF